MKLFHQTYDFIGLADPAIGIGTFVDGRDQVVFGGRPDAMPAGGDVT